MRILVAEHTSDHTKMMYFSEVVFVHEGHGMYRLKKCKSTMKTGGLYTYDQMVNLIFAMEKYEEVTDELNKSLIVGVEAVDLSNVDSRGRFSNGKKM